MQISFRSLECGICVLGGTMLICTGYALSLINPGRKKVYIATLKKSKKKNTTEWIWFQNFNDLLTKLKIGIDFRCNFISKEKRPYVCKLFFIDRYVFLMTSD